MTLASADLAWQFRAAATYTPTGGGAAARAAPRDGSTSSLTNGTASGKADILVYQLKTLTATTAATYDLYTGTDLKDLFGQTAAGRSVRHLAVWVDSGGDSSGVLVGGGSNPVPLFADATDKFKFFPSGPPFLAGSPAGIAVGATTGNLRIENLGAVSVTVGIYLAMSSA